MMPRPDKSLWEAEECGEIEEWREFCNLFQNCHSCTDFEIFYCTADYYYCPICFVEKSVDKFVHKPVDILHN